MNKTIKEQLDDIWFKHAGVIEEKIDKVVKLIEKREQLTRKECGENLKSKINEGIEAWKPYWEHKIRNKIFEEIDKILKKPQSLISMTFDLEKLRENLKKEKEEKICGCGDEQRR